MKEVVELYSKLVIGTFTFLGPSFTLLISLFSKQLDRATRRNQERLKTLIDLNGQTKALKVQIAKNERDTNLLNPKRQVKRLFGTLLLALAGIGFYYLQHSHFWPWKLAWIRITTILLSLALFLYCLFSQWQVFCVIINAKLDEEEERKQKETTLQTLQS